MPLSAVFIVPVGPGRERAFGRFCLFAKAHAPEFDILPYFDRAGEGCGIVRARLWGRVRGQYDIVASLDDDCEIGAGFSERVFQALDLFPATSLFTARMQQFNSRDVFGARMEIDDERRIFMHHVTFPPPEVPPTYLSVDWPLGGCTILTRRAHEALVPRELPVGEDIEWYGQARAAGLGSAVCIREVSFYHNIVDHPRIAGFRSLSNLLKAATVIWESHQLNMLCSAQTLRWHCGLAPADAEREYADWKARVGA